jgi:outer membrane immunogenic protein
MKKLFLGSILLIALSAGGSALAADMAVRARPLPPPPPVYNWTGCYVAAGYGYGLFNRDREVVSPGQTLQAPPFISVIEADPLFPKETFGGRGWLGTAQFGCDYQFASKWVIGAFVDGDWTNIRGDQSLFATFRGEAQLRWSWAVGGRIGWLVTPSLLTYFSAGYTQAKFDEVNYVNSARLSLNQPSPQAIIDAEAGATLQLASQKYDGFFIGGGTEYAFQWWPGLFWKTEYRFADYRSKTTPIICTCESVSAGPGLFERIHPYVQTVRTELVWRFGWGAARY